MYIMDLATAMLFWNSYDMSTGVGTPMTYGEGRVDTHEVLHVSHQRFHCKTSKLPQQNLQRKVTLTAM